MAELTKRKKKKTIKSRRSGLAAVPIEKGFSAVKDYFHLEIDRKDIANSVRSYVKKFRKSESSKILANPEYQFTAFTHHAATSFWYTQGIAETDTTKYWHESLKQYIDKLYISGMEISKIKINEEKANGNIITLSPKEKLDRKIRNTIMQEISDLEDEWIDGKDVTINLYNRFKFHGLSGSATILVRETIERWLLDYEDAYHKRCEQAVEGYSHLKKSELNRRIKACQDMLADLDRIKFASKASRNIKVSRPMAADKQVARVQYKKEDDDFKIMSIHPIQVIGKQRLYIFNTKYKELSYYETESPRGFEISGSTIKNFNKELSGKFKLKKPLEVFPTILAKNFNQISKFLDEKLVGNTKRKEANGRINKETILLRVLDK